MNNKSVYHELCVSALYFLSHRQEKTVCIRNVYAASVIRRQCCMIRILSGHSNSCQCKENNKRIY